MLTLLILLLIFFISIIISGKMIKSEKYSSFSYLFFIIAGLSIGFFAYEVMPSFGDGKTSRNYNLIYNDKILKIEKGQKININSGVISFDSNGKRFIISGNWRLEEIESSK